MRIEVNARARAHADTRHACIVVDDVTLHDAASIVEESYEYMCKMLQKYIAGSSGARTLLYRAHGG